MLLTLILDLILLEYSSTRLLTPLIIRIVFLVVFFQFRGFYTILIALHIRVNVESEASNELSPLHMLAVDHNGAVLCYLPLLGVRPLELPPLF